MLENLKELNKDIKFIDVNSPEFAKFGRVINLNTKEIECEAMKSEKPESGSCYLPSIDAFENLEIAKIIKDI